MVNNTQVKTTCGLCGGGCGVIATVEDGIITRIEGDPEHPVSKGQLCPRGQASLEFLYHPDRLKYPLKRAGEKGEGKWQRISWEEAFSVTADALNQIKKESGPEAVFMTHGSAKSFIDTHVVRLANAFGTPNFACADHVCHVPKMFGAEFTLGFYPKMFRRNPEDNSSCLVCWGANKEFTRYYVHRNFMQMVQKGCKLIVIDPLKTNIAQSADLWLQLRPGTDLALALGMINVIIQEELYDKEFVNNWTTGFDKLKAHIEDYTPEKMSKITWIPADLIVKAARMYISNKPGHIEMGNAVDHTLNSFQTGRAIAMLMALSGNIGVPGGELESPVSGIRYGQEGTSGSGIWNRWSDEFELRSNISKEKRQNKVGAEYTMIPDFRYIVPYALTNAILDGKPYHIRAGYVQAANPLSTWTNIKRVYEAFKKLDFLAVSDYFMTPTAALADIVFPAAMYPEFDAVQLQPNNSSSQLQRKITQVGECRSDNEIINGIAHKLGLGSYFWKDINHFWDSVMMHSGITFSQFKTMERFPGLIKPQLKKYLQSGFPTLSGKVELYSKELEDLKLDPLPVYYEPPETPYSAPELTKEYPLLITFRKQKEYYHSQARQIPSLRYSAPEPCVTINPETAKQLDIKQDDWVFIENQHGKIRQKAFISDTVDQRVIMPDPNWSFPEKGIKEFFGFTESNYNVLVSDEPPFSREVGSVNMRGIVCKVYKCNK